MVRIACCQVEPAIGGLAANAELIEAQIRAAVQVVGTLSDAHDFSLIRK